MKSVPTWIIIYIVWYIWASIFYILIYKLWNYYRNRIIIYADKEYILKIGGLALRAKNDIDGLPNYCLVESAVSDPVKFISSATTGKFSTWYILKNNKYLYLNKLSGEIYWQSGLMNKENFSAILLTQTNYNKFALIADDYYIGTSSSREYCTRLVSELVLPPLSVPLVALWSVATHSKTNNKCCRLISI